ncbi:sugar transferase [Flavobacteriaceae bacterium AU392]|nr:sugar transferase [Flavobacteriaceae bacterium]RKM84876.1 sugar transferase [Flavobacteriaceae bacterium AU392]
MTRVEKNIKRVFDVFFSFIGLILLGWVILLVAVISKIFIKGKGFFKQKRIGQYGKEFIIYKIETIHPEEAKKENPYISEFGQFIRKYKIDEFPQLWNVLEGTMSFVGPRPDLPEYLDMLEEKAKVILNIKPGITGPATLYYRNEEKLLNLQKKPKEYNKEVIWPQKVAMNTKYINEYSFVKDIYYIYKTLFS